MTFSDKLNEDLKEVCECLGQVIQETRDSMFDLSSLSLYMIELDTNI